MIKLLVGMGLVSLLSVAYAGDLGPDFDLKAPDLKNVVQLSGGGHVFKVSPSANGSSNVISALQKNSTNSLAVGQAGSGNVANVNQLGEYGNVNVIQRGSNNQASIRQIGNRDSLSVSQTGAGNSLDVLQSSNNLVKKISQTGGTHLSVVQ
jgi:Curlin associated repeat